MMHSGRKYNYLIDNGFAFHKIYNDEDQHIPYPKTVTEAEEFVAKYRNKAGFRQEKIHLTM